MRLAACLFGLACLLVGGFPMAPGARPASAQPVPARSADDIPRTDPAGVVTVPVPIPRALARRAVSGETVTFGVRAADSFRLLGESRGRLDLRTGEAPVLPVTLAVGERIPSGPVEAVVVEYVSEVGRDTVSAPVHVRPSPGISVTLSADHGPAVPGADLRLRFEIENVGNVVDTVSLRLESRLGSARPRAGLVLQPFERTAGEMRLEVDPHAIPLPTLIVAKAVGREVREVTTLEVPVEPPRTFLSSLVHVPMRVFVGSSFGTGSDPAQAFGLEAEGELRPGLRFRLEAHDGGGDMSNFAFRGLQTGPRFRAELRSSAFSAAVGDVHTRTAAFAGYRLQGRGVAATVGSGALRVSAHAARPVGQDPDLEGTQVAAGLDLRTGSVHAGIHGLVEQKRGRTFEPAHTLRSAYLRVASATPGAHSFDLDAGVLSLEEAATGERAIGPALSARYAYRDASTVLDLDVQRRPALANLGTAAPDEVRLSVVTEAPRDFGLEGRLFRVDGPPTSGDRGRARLEGIEAGPFIRRGENRYRLLGRLRRVQRTEAVEELYVEARADVGAGPGEFDARVELGRARAGTGPDRTVLRTRLGYGLRDARGWGRIGLVQRRDAWSDGHVSLDVSGAYRISDDIEIHGSYGGSVDGIVPTGARIARLGAQVDIGGDLAVLVGVEKGRPHRDGAPARLSVGLRKGFPVPLPVPRRRSVQGTVFEDFDGDGLKSPAEPYLDDVRLAMAGATVSTRRGHFVFPASAPRSEIVVDVASLDTGFLPPPPVKPEDDRVDIPVHRAASLSLEAFLDQDGDGRRDSTETPLGDVEVEIAEAGRTGWVMRSADDGSLRLGAIRPGSYRIRVNAATLPWRARSPKPVSVTLRAGQSAEIPIAVPVRPVVILDADRSSEAATGAGGEDGTGGGRK